MTPFSDYPMPLTPKEKEFARKSLNRALSSESIDGFKSAIMEAVRMRGVTQVAREAGVSRVGIYKALEPGSSPSFQTVHKIIETLGLRFEIHITE